VDPVTFVQSFCENLAAHPTQKRAHAVQRLTPIVSFGKATENGVKTLANSVLKPFFHGEETGEKKYAIRTNSRNNTTLARDDTIRYVASVVEPPHRVDLKDPDLLILVEIYKVSGYHDKRQLHRLNR
jgi:tRNA acetyltransferase TAN1